MPSPFRLTSGFEPKGDQPRAIEQLVAGLGRSERHQVLLGITGSGKTFTIANVIQQTGRPTLILAPNKTLAAQLYGEMRELFPENAVEYFVSYYDYYQPEAYIPSTDTFIDKDAIINDQIDRMRHSATVALLSRRDVIIVASVSCIYGIGSAESYHGLVIQLTRGEELRRDTLLRQLVDIQYERNDVDFHRGTLSRPRRRGRDLPDLRARDGHPHRVLRRHHRVDQGGRPAPRPREGHARALRDLPRLALRDAPGPDARAPSRASAKSCASGSTSYDKEGRFLEKQRLEQRTLYDLELMEQMGFCSGIENYSRHLSGRKPGEAPPTLIDYFPPDFLMVLDESHQTVPQVQAMYRGDRARKETLVEYGFRLPSALDNRPLKFEEFEEHVRQAIYVSATPGEYELQQGAGGRRRAAHPAHGPHGSRGRGAARVRPGRRPARRDQASRCRRTSACS